MKKLATIFLVCAVCLGLTLGLTGCGKNKCAVPTGLTITIEGRLMTVTWNAVPCAAGYEIYTTSADCTSANRIINTQAETVTDHAKEAKTNVTFVSETSFTLMLMAATNNAEAAMATAVTAKIKSLGNDSKDSKYSKVVNKTI